jgi:hypothetical protein
MTIQLRSVTVLAGCALLTACVATTPNYDARRGDAVQIAQARQTLDPEAAVRNAMDPVAGMDARAARAAYDRYLLSFVRPTPQPNVFTIGVGGGQAIGSASR